MKRFVLALIVCPVVAAAQKPAGGWSFEVATGLTQSYGGPSGQRVGPALEFLVDRALSQRVALRLAANWGSTSGSGSACQVPPDTCTGTVGTAMAAVAAGITVARHRDAGPYASVRLGAYMSETDPGVSPGGYLGLGVAAPTRFGAFTFELGVHTYQADTQRWVVPLRVGFRWRP